MLVLVLVAIRRFVGGVRGVRGFAVLVMGMKTRPDRHVAIATDAQH
jgi:hypothetical protein